MVTTYSLVGSSKFNAFISHERTRENLFGATGTDHLTRTPSPSHNFDRSLLDSSPPDNTKL